MVTSQHAHKKFVSFTYSGNGQWHSKKSKKKMRNESK